MSAVRITRKIESETLHLPEIKDFIGQTVEITICAEEPAQPDARANPYDAFFALAGEDLVDPEAYKRLREASMI